jgi:hypothetical protein
MSTIDTSIPVPDDEPDDDVAAELEALAIRRRRKLPRVTLALCVAIVGAGAFIGGAEAQKHLGSSPSSGTTGGAAASGFAARFRGAAGGRTANAFGGGATIGSVTAIKGSTLYVTDTSGNVVKVSTSAASQVSKTTTGTVKDIRPGDTVVVRGTQGKNGTIAASSISLGGGIGAGTFGGGGGAAGGGSANGGATGFGFNGSSTKGGG